MGRPRRSTGATPLAGRKRRRPELAPGGWASLPTDIVVLVTGRLLDVTDYAVFRAVCSGWRSCTPAPRDRDPALCDPRLRPRGWVALCDGDAVRPDDAGEIDMFHTRTARRARVRVPGLRGHRIVGFSDGLLVLLHKTSAKVRVASPFIAGVAVDLPSLAPVCRETGASRSSFRAMKVAVCTTSSAIAVVVWFRCPPVVVAAEASSDRWEILHHKLWVESALVFQGRLYATMGRSGTEVQLYPLDIVQLYPPTPRRPPLGIPEAAAHIPAISGSPSGYDFLLAESGGKMLLVLHHDAAPADPPDSSSTYSTHLPTDWWKRLTFTLYEVNLNTGVMTPVTCLHDRALFLSHYGCLSVSATDLPSLRGNSIYFSVASHPVLMYSLATGSSEELAAECQIHDGRRRIRPSVRPFTIADHLLTFCHPQEWTKGLMFHEYHEIPESFTELLKNIRQKTRSSGFFPLGANNMQNLPSRWWKNQIK